MKSFLSAIALLLMICILFSGCSKETRMVTISSVEAKAESVYLTRDHNNNPVIAWTENLNGNVSLMVAVTSDRGEIINNNYHIPLSTEVATHAESMPKVAYAADGTIVAAYEKKTPTEKNKYAGAIYYRVSQDDGKTWTPEKFIHSDTVAGRSRSYFDIDRLPDGTIGAAWLDIKIDLENGGRSVRFAKMTPNKKFAGEILIDSSACQCCRIDVYSHENKDVMISYRGLKKGSIGRQIRDMMIASSPDGGSTFSPAIVISADNWNIDGCPHTGPSICGNKAGLVSLWYTEGTGTGVFVATRTSSDAKFSPKDLVSSGGRHPQLCANGETIAMLWEENFVSDGKTVTVIHHRLSVNGTEKQKGAVTSLERNAYFPVITSLNDGFLIAYLIEDKNGQTRVQVRNL